MAQVLGKLVCDSCGNKEGKYHAVKGGAGTYRLLCPPCFHAAKVIPFPDERDVTGNAARGR